MAKVIKNKDGLRTCYSQEEPRETWLLNGMWDPGYDSGAEKEEKVKANKIWMKYRVKMLFNAMINTDF